MPGETGGAHGDPPFQPSQLPALLQVTSLGSGGGMASVGFYGAGKVALDSVSEAPAMEVEQFGTKVTIVEMGGYATGLFTSGTTATPDPAYASLRAKLAEMWGEDAGPDPATAAPVIMEPAKLPEPPRRPIVGSRSFDIVQKTDQERAELYRAGESLSRMAPG
ncbi:hypothetical protein [Streptomyces sp. NPDC058632]|uniref:hypothetical protein n=1 Tax=unclassified Streptomyces TaxID=2593676 RepID=UPI00366557BE